ncbi:MAG: hypothetical protein N4A38_03315 [Candidatus Gracilibacteria bacterium]|nr:hypothetical protein [Candidatus Gracilibacteria bacterium]
MNFEEENKTPEIVETDNIFDEISSGFEDDFEEEEQELELTPELKRMKIITNVLLGVTVVLIISVVLTHSYVWFQKSDATNTLLPPMTCNLFSGEADVDNSAGCSSVTALQEKYENNLTNEKFQILDKTLRLIPNTYKVEDFMNSKEIVFLLDKTKNKVRPLTILSEFDDVKRGFSSVGKSDIECKNITIDKEEEITADCTVYSYDWQTDINGTSQSLAALFQAEFEKSNKFSLIEKQRNFSSYPVFDKPLVSKKTDLRLHLKYEGGNTINF